MEPPITPERRGAPDDDAASQQAGRPMPAKKSLPDFLQEFEERLQMTPAGPVTAVGDALSGRADGTIRYPVESSPHRGAPDRPARRPSPRASAQAPGGPPPASPPPPAPPPVPSPSGTPAPPQQAEESRKRGPFSRRRRRRRRH